MKKVWKFLTSMKLAIALLLILAAACAGASFINQGQTYEFYARMYSERTAGLILALSLDDAFHSWWFIAINAFLCLNLLGCNLIRLPQLIRRTKAEKTPDPKVLIAAGLQEDGVRDPQKVFAAMHFSAPAEGTFEGKKALSASRNGIGIWGAWVCHLGILLLIIGFSLGQMTHQEYSVYGVPGQTKMIEGTDLAVTIDDFRIGLREDDTVEQYTADITVQDLSSPNGAKESAEISVNHPAKVFGMSFYQNSTGWAAKVGIKKGGNDLSNDVICAGEYVPVKDLPELVVFFNAFYPDYVMVPGVGPQTQSGRLNNPAYLYTLYYKGEILGMNVLMPDESITVEDYEITFSEPQSYTLIQVKKDSFQSLAFLGGILTMLGLVLAFYLLPEKMLAVEEENGLYTIYGHSPKGGALFKERLKKAVLQAKEGAGEEENHV